MTNGDRLSYQPHREAFWHWKPTSLTQAEDAERAMLAPLNVPYIKEEVEVASGKINMIKVGSGPPFVLIHGMGAALGLWVANLPAWAPSHTVYALDLPGFGLSSRAPFIGNSVEEAENYFLDTVEEWREKMGIERMTLLGHSMGGYLSAVYALRHPERISHLILADPWGVAARKELKLEIPWYWKCLATVLTQFNPLAVVRASGPWGPDLITKFRKDLARKFVNLYPDPHLALNYIYHMNAQEPTGETAFATLSDKLVWAKEPLIERLPSLPAHVPVSLMFGEKTWMDRDGGGRLADFLGRRATYHEISKAGHHIYIDNAAEFNELVLQEIANANPLPKN
eukprot:GGOE01005810.1.p1 GENE.GGOE01005810.1~~GGOE01005810.1.p1  ORF type:complete len:367 (+),score=65.71 GGOE01005810.1:83-1102(+)